MGTNKKQIAPEHLTEWLASTGFLFPSNEIELARFEKLYGDPNSISEGSINHERILKHVFENEAVVKRLNPDEVPSSSELKMVARNGNGNLPKHILDKMKKNHINVKDDGSQKKED